MLRFLASVSPAALVAFGAIPALLGGWAAREVKFALIDRPAIERLATARADDACALRVADAAGRAEQAERARQQRASAEALRLYREALANSERQLADADARLQQEIKDYEAELARDGRSCRLTERDLEWLHDDGTEGANGGR